MRLLILTSDIKGYNPQKIKKEAENQSVKTTLAFYSDLIFNFNSKTLITLWGEGILSFDIFIFRAGKLNDDFKIDASSHINLLTYFLKTHNKIVLNSKSFLNFPEKLDKLTQQLVFCQKNVTCVKSIHSGIENIDVTKLPLLAKPLIGSHGDKIVLLKNKSELIKWHQEHDISSFLLQNYLKSNSDYRIMVINSKALGAMRRIKTKDKIVSNVGAGGQGKKAILTKELASLAVKAVKALHCDFGGVDIMHDLKGRPYVLEVNRKAKFQSFEKHTGVNVAKELIKYLKTC